MNPEFFKYLLIVEQGGQAYANAFLFRGLIVTAGHVGHPDTPLSVPDNGERGSFDFIKLPQQDLAVSHRFAQVQGFTKAREPKLKEHVIVLGHHGPDRNVFQIKAQVVRSREGRRVIIERHSKKKFQLGMSGCPVITPAGEVVGVLVEGENYFEQDRVLLESLSRVMIWLS